VTADGTAHVIWNDGSGDSHAVSKDKGVTWLQKPRISGQGGSSHLAVGPDKEVAVRMTPSSASGGKFDAGVDLIAVSTDAGVTWKNHPAPGHRDWNSSPGNGPPRWVEPLAWDAQAALYSFWADGKALWLGQSVDQGEKWTSWQLTSGDEDCFYPYLVTRGLGELGVRWFSGRRETLQADVAVIDIQKGIAPKKAESAPFRVDWWQDGPTSEAPLVRCTGGEYVALTFLKSDGLSQIGWAGDGQPDREYPRTASRILVVEAGGALIP